MTLSIVALDRDSGLLGVAVSSHWFNTGSAVPALIPGLGAIAVQAVIGSDISAELSRLLAERLDAPDALAQVVAADPLADWRQIGIVDKDGKVGAHTGSSCIPCAAGMAGTDFVVQANMMLNDDVVPAMFESYSGNSAKTKAEKNAGTEQSPHIIFAQRLLATLQAGQAAGGDIRGQQSAGLFVVSAKLKDSARLVDLQVPDHKEPLVELARLLHLQAAYDLMNLGDGEIARGEIDSAIKAYGDAAKMLPNSLECRYWQAITLLNAGKAAEGEALMQEVYAKPGHWRELTNRLLKCGLLSPP